MPLISAWGTQNATINEPTVAGISAWGRANATLVNVSPSPWGRANATVGTVAFYEFHLATPGGWIPAKMQSF